MALFEPNQLRHYRYKVTQCVVYTGSETITLQPMNVVGLMVIDNFVENIFPIFKLNLVTNSSTFYSISKYKTSLKIKLVVNKYYLTKDNKGEFSQKSSYEHWINDMFSIIPEEYDIKKDTDIDIRKELYKSDPGNESRFDKSLELYIYRDEIANGMKKRLNEVLVNTTLTSAITWALSKSGVGNCIMSPLENDKRYDTIFIPPLVINKLLLHLDAMYGFYKSGSMIYFGLKRGYILNFRGGCTAYENGEKRETCVLVPILSDSIAGANGGSVFKNDEKNYIFCNYEDIEFENPSVVSNVTSGNDAVVINNSSGIISSSKSKAESINNRSNIAIINNTTNNPWIDITYTAQSSSKSMIATLSVTNIDIDVITPNKLFTLIIEDPTVTNSAKGKYMLTGAVHKFINDSAIGDFSLISGMELRRMEATSSSSIDLKNN